MASKSADLKDYTIKELEEAIAEKKRKHEATPSTNPSTGSQSSSGDRATKRSRKEPPPAVYKAQVDLLTETDPATATSSIANVDSKIIGTIQKCLTTANHPSAAKKEVEVALLKATSLMSRYNVSQTEMLARETESNKKKHIGCSALTILRADGDRSKVVKSFDYVDGLGRAMEIYLDCEHFTSSKRRDGKKYGVGVHFYGASKNTMAAAWGFEVVYNQMSEWARLLTTEESKKSYYRGITDEQNKLAKAAKAAEEAQAKRAGEEAKKAQKEVFEARVRQEDIERQASLDRLKPILLPEEEEEEMSDGIVEEAVTPAKPSGEEQIPDTSDALSTASWPSDTTFNGFSDDEAPMNNDNDESDDDDDHVVETDFIEDDDDILDVNESLDDAIRKHSNPALPSPSPPAEADTFPSPLPEQKAFPPLPVKDPAPSSNKARLSPAPPSAAKSIQSQNAAHALPTPPPASSGPNEPSGAVEIPESNWESHQQLILWRNTAKEMAEQWLKDSGIKLSKGRKKDGTIKDWKAYHQGEKDSRKIDVHRKKNKNTTSKGETGSTSAETEQRVICY